MKKIIDHILLSTLMILRTISNLYVIILELKNIHISLGDLER